MGSLYTYLVRPSPRSRSSSSPRKRPAMPETQPPDAVLLFGHPIQG